MAYEVRIDGKTVAVHDRSEEAIDQVRASLQDRPECEPEIFDTTTGKVFEPAASVGWREHLARTMR
jgi:hypothetical protein